MARLLIFTVPMFSQGALKNQVRAGRFSGFNRPNQLRPVCCLRALDLNVIWIISEEGASACFRDEAEAEFTLRTVAR